LGGFVVLKSDLPPKVPPKCGIGKMIRSMAEGVRYIEPKIVSAKRGWFIALKYEYPDQVGKYKRFEISAGINYELSKKLNTPIPSKIFYPVGT